MAMKNDASSKSKPNTRMNAPRVPGPLATPSPFDQAAVSNISRAVNTLVADAFALYIKTKNFHWHLSGRMFRDLHLLFDEQAEQIFASTDPLAERVRRIGGTTIRSITEISRLQTIHDDEDELVSPFDMVQRLMEDNRTMLAGMREAHRICDEAGDLGTTNLLEDLIDQTEKRIWFLFEITQDEEFVQLQRKA